MSEIKIRCRGVIVHDEKLLVVRHSGGRDFYALPGGHLDFGEDPKECMYRELVEELGVVPEIGQLLCVYTFVNSEGKQSIEFFFEITNGADFIAHEEMEKTHEHEIDEVRWVSREDEVTILPEEFHDLFKQGEGFSDAVRFMRGSARQVA